MNMKASLLLLIAALVQSSSGFCAPCSIPPSESCSSLEAAIACGVTRQCDAANFTRTAEPVELELCYESLCPACRRFLTQIVYPTWVLLKDILTVKLVPYGNAKERIVGNHYRFTCQHGVQECQGNLIEACLLNMTDKSFQIINCMETSLDVPRAAKSCLELYSADLSWDTVKTCAEGDQGHYLMHLNALRTKVVKPPNTYVPWLVLNGVHTEKLEDGAFASLFTMVCNMYKGQKPPICGGK